MFLELLYGLLLNTMAWNLFVTCIGLLTSNPTMSRYVYQHDIMYVRQILLPLY